ncbi:MAG: hypothetical protein EBZ77_04965, partial [Chitinophagia bacterium]|nr:hypothetical protein [Chitinophagia bacterium]
VPESPAQQVRSDWRALMQRMSYKAIMDNIPYLIFVAVLCVIYIGNNHHSIDLQRDISKKTKELESLHWKYWDAKTRLMEVRTEDQVRVNAATIGIEPSLLPAYKVTTKQ